jgi:hypothetical protein
MWPAPAKDVVEYYPHRFTWNFWERGEYMGFPTDEVDQKWSHLYNCKTHTGQVVTILTIDSWNLGNSNSSGSPPPR